MSQVTSNNNISVNSNYPKVLLSQQIRSPKFGNSDGILNWNQLASFDDVEKNTAKDAGFIVFAGIIIRQFFQQFVNKALGSYLSKKQDISESEMLKNGLAIMEKEKFLNDRQTGIYDNGRHFLNGKVRLFIDNTGREAYYTSQEDYIKVAKKTLISIPHEVGHAIQEHKTVILKKLQNMRGKSQWIAMALYALGRSPSNERDGQKTFFGKCKDFMYKYNLVVPFVAFAPELITEAAASIYGIKNLKAIGASQKILKTTKKYYLAAFCTYLALPVFMMMDYLVFNATSKK